MLSFQDDLTYADPEKNETSLKKIHNWCSLTNVMGDEISFFWHNIFKDQHSGHTGVDKYVKLTVAVVSLRIES